MKVLVATTLAALVLLPSSGAASSQTVLLVQQGYGHPYEVLTKPFHAPPKWRIRYSFTCRKGAEDVRLIGRAMTVGIVPGRSAHSTGDDAVNVFVTPVKIGTQGTFAYGRGGYWRLLIDMPAQCSYLLSVRA